MQEPTQSYRTNSGSVIQNQLRLSHTENKHASLKQKYQPDFQMSEYKEHKKTQSLLKGNDSTFYKQRKLKVRKR